LEKSQTERRSPCVPYFEKGKRLGAKVQGVEAILSWRGLQVETSAGDVLCGSMPLAKARTLRFHYALAEALLRWPSCTPSANFLDDLGVERFQIVGPAATDQALVDVDFLVDPLGPALRRSACRLGHEVSVRTINDVRVDQGPRPWQITPTGLPTSKESADELDRVGVVRSWSGLATPPAAPAVVVVGVRLAHSLVRGKVVALSR